MLVEWEKYQKWNRTVISCHSAFDFNCP
jgi:hypothetical protein